MNGISRPKQFRPNLLHRPPQADGRSGIPANAQEQAGLSELMQRFETDRLLVLRAPLPKHVSEDQAAELCLERAADQPQKVSVLLEALPAVAHAVMDLLPVVGNPEALQLAQALLDAGYPIERHDKLPENVTQLLDNRREQREQLWQAKQGKYERQKKNGGDRVGAPYERHPGQPYLSLNPKYSPINRNGELKAHGSVLWCRHLELALSGDHAKDVKVKLRKLSKGDVDWVDQKTVLEADKGPTDNHQNLTQVVFSRKNFGRVLATLSSLLAPGKEYSFSIGFDSSTIPDNGHAMRVFLQRDDSPFLRVSVYEPNVTGDRMHMRVLPEELQGLHFDQFDSLKTCKEAGAEVLSMDVRDTELAKQLMGRWIEPDITHQQLAFRQALFGGNVAGMWAALEVSCSDGSQSRLKSEDLKEALLAKTVNGVSDWHEVWRSGSIDSIRALCEIVRRSGMSPEDQKELLLAKDERGFSTLQRVLERNDPLVVKLLLQGLDLSGLKAEDWKAIFLEKDRWGIARTSVAAESASPDVVKALHEGLSRSGLKSDDWEEFARLSDEKSLANFQLLLQCDPDVIKMAGRLLELSGLSVEDRKALFLERCDWRVEGKSSSTLEFALIHALKNGRADVIDALGEVFGKSGLNLKDKKEIVISMEFAISKALRLAFKNGRFDAVQALCKFLDQSGLDSGDWERIFLLNERPSVLNVHSALENGDPHAINALSDVVKIPRLDAVALSELLAPFSSESTGLHRAMQEGHHEAIRAYLNMVIGLQRNPATQLRGEDAKRVLNYIRDATRGSHTLGFVTRMMRHLPIHNAGYNRMRAQDPGLAVLLKEAKASLKVAAGAA